MTDMHELEQVERIMFDCSDYVETWSPDLTEEAGWGTKSEAYDRSYVSTLDYDALIDFTKELTERIKMLENLVEGGHTNA